MSDLSKFFPVTLSAPLAAEWKELNELAERARSALMIYSTDSMCHLLYGGGVGALANRVTQALNMSISKEQKEVRAKIEDQLYGLLTACAGRHAFAKDDLYYAEEEARQILIELCNDYNNHVPALSVVCAELCIMSKCKPIEKRNLVQESLCRGRGPHGPASGR